MITTDATRARMSRQRSKDTGVEVALRRALHGMGLRYRVHRRPLKGIRREADVVFGPTRVAVYVDGCFWHGCPTHATWPKRNAEFWRNKIEETAPATPTPTAGWPRRDGWWCGSGSTRTRCPRPPGSGTRSWPAARPANLSAWHDPSP